MTTLYKGCVKSFRTIALPAPFARSASTAALAQTGDRAQFDIPKQPLSAALKAFAEQADMQLLYRSETINGATVRPLKGELDRSEEHTSELQSLMRISYAVFCLNKKHKRKCSIVVCSKPNYTTKQH